MQGHLSKDKAPRLEDFLDERDYVGAAAFLRFQQKDGASEDQTSEWLAYAHYHNWEHAQVLPASCPTRPEKLTCTEMHFAIQSCTLISVG